VLRVTEPSGYGVIDRDSGTIDLPGIVTNNRAAGPGGRVAEGVVVNSITNGTAASAELARSAASALAPEADGLIDLDPALFGRALADAAAAAAQHPVAVAEAGISCAVDLTRAALATASRALGASTPGPLPPTGGDRRFADPAWEENPTFFWLCQSYLVFRRLAENIVAAGELDQATRAKADFAVSFLADALAPTNLLLTNPAALKRAFDTGGRSVLIGARNFLDDLRHNGGRPRQVDTSPFQLGENIATTPSKVVFRNDLIELLQYLPQTDEVHAVPLLASPPWINKYYIMDLAPGRSLIEWAVQHGRTVFAISYRNPDASMSELTMDDYSTLGVRAALEAVSEITGSDTVDVLAVCLGGALAAMTAGQLAAGGEDRIGTLTLINTLLDYSEPGLLGCFVDEGTVSKLERRMARKGYLDGADMAGTFNALRANDLIFSYVASNWLMGKQPPAFDLLAWNADATRMPAAMHSEYLRSLYMENQLANGTMELGGQRLDLGAVTADTYVVAAERDHIVPWRSSYRSTALLGGDVRYVLVSGGHIAGIVSPPEPKAWVMTSEEYPLSADEWREHAIRDSESWWEDWALWMAERAGPLGKPPRLGGRRHPVLADGPGEYVLG
jgi:polyhydroxyalkanoate synthase subunit PhaC